MVVTAGGDHEQRGEKAAFAEKLSSLSGQSVALAQLPTPPAVDLPH